MRCHVSNVMPREKVEREKLHAGEPKVSRVMSVPVHNRQETRHQALGSMILLSFVEAAVR